MQTNAPYSADLLKAIHALATEIANQADAIYPDRTVHAVLDGIERLHGLGHCLQLKVRCHALRQYIKDREAQP